MLHHLCLGVCVVVEPVQVFHECASRDREIRVQTDSYHSRKGILDVFICVFDMQLVLR